MSRVLPAALELPPIFIELGRQKHGTRFAQIAEHAKICYGNELLTLFQITRKRRYRAGRSGRGLCPRPLFGLVRCRAARIGDRRTRCVFAHARAVIARNARGAARVDGACHAVTATAQRIAPDRDPDLFRDDTVSQPNALASPTVAAL